MLPRTYRPDPSRGLLCPSQLRSPSSLVVGVLVLTSLELVQRVAERQQARVLLVQARLESAIESRRSPQFHHFQRAAIRRRGETRIRLGIAVAIRLSFWSRQWKVGRQSRRCVLSNHKNVFEICILRTVGIPILLRVSLVGNARNKTYKRAI